MTINQNKRWGQIQTMDQRSGCVVETGYHNRSDRLDRIDETFDGLIECQRALKFEPLCRSNSRSSHKSLVHLESKISHGLLLFAELLGDPSRVIG
jgi:hypothetical protein